MLCCGSSLAAGFRVCALGHRDREYWVTVGASAGVPAGSQKREITSFTTDQTTYQRLWEFVEELRQRLQRRLAATRSKEEIRARAELWVHNGRPAGRDLEFWLQAEAELREHTSE
jgi:hypothetical protein